MKLVTADIMRAIDREAIENRGIPGLELMENAGRGIAERIRDNIFAGRSENRVAIFCGKGNNGGDGFVVGRYLHQFGNHVTIYYPSPVEKLSDDGRYNHGRAEEINIKLVAVESIDQLPDKLTADCIVDAVFGTGFEGAPRGLLREFIGYINNQAIPVIAVDCPSGLNVDTGQYEGVVVDADYSFPLALPKIGMFFSPGREIAGQVDVVPIGIPDEIVDSFNIKHNLITAEKVASLLPARKPDGHKGTFGKLFILAGSAGLTGAATLAANAAGRSGSGLVTVGCPKSLNPILESKLTEAMTLPLPDVARKGVLALRGLGMVLEKLKEADAVAIGPGVGRHHETRELIRRLVSRLEKTAIIDADGINAFEKDREALTLDHTGLILTPHPGEFRRITDEPMPDKLYERFEFIAEYAARYKAVIALKGSPTVVVDSDGTVYVNSTGNDGMATGGSGDVLTGIIGSFLGQGMTPIDSTVAGVYIHGLAGDLAADDFGKRSLLAGDLIDYLPEAFQLIQNFRES